LEPTSISRQDFLYYKRLMNNQNNYIIKTNHHGTDLSNVYFKIFQPLVS
jgi:hypothetical protein